jgi:hypothetical protein
VISLPGLRITLLSPTRAQLAALAARWPRVLGEVDADLSVERPPADTLRGEAEDATTELHRLTRRPFKPDGSAANASSIAFVAEDDDGDRVLLAGDATAEVLVAALRRLVGRERYRIDLCKVPHHGSRYNTSSELIELLDCRHWLISTSGARFGHPSREAMARILCRPEPATVWFNYYSPSTAEYASTVLGDRYGFTAVHAKPERPGIAMVVDRRRVQPVQ